MKEPTQSQKLRIAVWYNLPSGGAKRALSDHVRGLVAQGHEVVVWRPPVHELDYLSIADIAEEREIPLATPSVPDGGRIQRMRRSMAAEQAKRQAMMAHSKKVAEEIDTGRFDVLFANTCRSYAAPWIGRFARLPKVLYLQEPVRFLHEASADLPWPARSREEVPGSLRRKARWLQDEVGRYFDHEALRLFAADELENARSYDRILVNSIFSRESIIRSYNLDANVCYLGVDASRFENQRLAREPFVISVGTFHRSKNPDFVVRAVGSIPAAVRPPLIWVANTVYEDERERVTRLAKELGVDFTLRQYVPDAELLDLLNRATAMAYAPHLEPFGYAPIEANACGLPAVVVAEGGVKETIVDGLNGLVVPHRPEAMGHAIASLLQNPASTREMGERASIHVRQNWSIDRATRDLEANLREVIRERK